VFQAAPAIVGGREHLVSDGKLERGAIEERGGYNNFQARYIIRHEWTGPIECQDPQRGIWGGPPGGGGEQPKVARDLAFVERGAVLADYVTAEGAERIEADVGPLPAGPIAAPLPDPRKGLKGGGGGGGGDGAGCAHCSSDPNASRWGALGLALFGLLGAARVRRRRDRGAA
jgi:MYXO-CTERM domain-containing protein